MDAVSTFAKILSSDSSLAHAGTRRLSRPVSLCCGRVLCKLCEQGFFRGDRVRLLGRHGHRLRCWWSGTSADNFWVGDLTEDEAKELLNLHGHKDKTDEFLEACPLAALFALFCRETHPALSGQPLAFS